MFVVGLSGVTNGGKSTIANRLLAALPKGSSLFCQDNYYYPINSPHHIPSPGSTSAHNWDVVSSIDMTRMVADIRKAISCCNFNTSLTHSLISHNEQSTVASTSCKTSTITSLHKSPNQTPDENISILQKSINSPIILIDGFLLYDSQELTQLCNLKFFFTLSKQQCLERRLTRVYDPPDVPGYFDECAWPMYEAYFMRTKNTCTDIIYVNGAEPIEHNYKYILCKIIEKLE